MNFVQRSIDKLKHLRYLFNSIYKFKSDQVFSWHSNTEKFSYNCIWVTHKILIFIILMPVYPLKFNTIGFSLENTFFDLSLILLALLFIPIFICCLFAELLLPLICLPFLLVDFVVDCYKLRLTFNETFLFLLFLYSSINIYTEIKNPEKTCSYLKQNCSYSSFRVNIEGSIIRNYVGDINDFYIIYHIYFLILGSYASYMNSYFGKKYLFLRVVLYYETSDLLKDISEKNQIYKEMYFKLEKNGIFCCSIDPDDDNLSQKVNLNSFKPLWYCCIKKVKITSKYMELFEFWESITSSNKGVTDYEVNFDFNKLVLYCIPEFLDKKIDSILEEKWDCQSSSYDIIKEEILNSD